MGPESDRPSFPRWEPVTPDLAKFTRRCTFPYLNGVYLAVNAIPDAHLLVDGPVCAFQKIEQVFGSHDLMSTLMDAGTRHRVVHTAMHVDNAVEANRDRYLAVVRDLVASPSVGTLFHTSYPVAVVIGTPYENWLSEVPGIRDKLVLAVPGLSLEADWLRGYAETLLALAKGIPLDVPPAAAGEPPRDAARDPRKVAIVGYFLDRNEDDHLGNVAEIRRLLAALDLDLVTVWLEGTPTADLARVAEAGTILSLPHGRAAAEVLAGRTGARLVPCEVPFGIDATARFLRTAAAACGGGREEAAESLIRAELARCMPRLRWLVPKRLAHGRWAFAGDPALIPGLCEIASLVGARVDLAVAWTHRPPETLWDPAPPPATEVVVLHDQNAGALRETLEARADRIDLLIGNHHVVLEHLLPNSLGFLEFGFPSLIHHGIGDDPFLGYRGFLRFLSRIADQFYDWDLEFEEVDV